MRRLLVLVLLPMVSLRAQSVSAHALLSEFGAEEFGHPLGVGLSLDRPLLGGPFRWRVGVDAVVGAHRYLAAPCTPAIPVGTPGCSLETLRNATNMQSATLGVLLPVLHQARGGLWLTGDLGLGRIATVTDDLLGQRRYDASQFIWRRAAGLEARWRVVASRPLSLGAGYTIGSLRPVVKSGIVDGYAPFDQPIDLRHAWLGLTIDLARPASPRTP